MEFLVIAGTAFLLGWFVVSALPSVMGYIPATLQSNKWLMILATGGAVFVAFFVIAWAARTATGRTVRV